MYITYSDFDCTESGSQVRPKKMREAFESEGHDLFVLSGRQSLRHSARKDAVASTLKWLKRNRPDICYIESSSSSAVYSRLDRKLIRRLSKMKVPTAYYYRDAYHLFPADFSTRKAGIIAVLRDFYLAQLRSKTEKLISKYVNIVYFPTCAMSELFNFSDKRVLPPGAEQNNTYTSRQMNYTSVYVGGISERYGGNRLVDSFRILNEKTTKYKLLLVCRKTELKQLNLLESDKAWLTISHASGEGLNPLYKRASIGLIPLGDIEYNNLAVPVKLFEYIGHFLPVVSTSLEGVAELIDTLDIGISTGFSQHEFAQGIRKICEDKALFDRYQRNTRHALRNGNTWGDRARQVISDLHEYA